MSDLVHRLKHLLRQAEFHGFLFVLVLLVFSWPFFGSAGTPPPGSLFLYLFLPWGIVIFLLFIISQSLTTSSSSEPGSNQKTRKE